MKMNIYFDASGNLKYDDESVLGELGIYRQDYNRFNGKLREEEMITKLRETYYSPGGKEVIQKLIESDNHQDLIYFYGFGDLCSEKLNRGWWRNKKKRENDARYNNNLLKFVYDMDEKNRFDEDEKK